VPSYLSSRARVAGTGAAPRRPAVTRVSRANKTCVLTPMHTSERMLEELENASRYSGSMSLAIERGDWRAFFEEAAAWRESFFRCAIPVIRHDLVVAKLRNAKSFYAQSVDISRTQQE